MNDATHPPVWAADLYAADRTLVDPAWAEHMDTCPECRQAVGLSEQGGRTARMRAPTLLRPRVRIALACVALAATTLIAIGLERTGDRESSSAAPTGRAKGPVGEPAVSLMLRRGTQVSPWSPEADGPLHPGETLVFLPTDVPGHPVIAYFEAAGNAGALADPRVGAPDEAPETIGFKLDAYVGRQRVTLAYFDAPPDIGTLDEELRADWAKRAPSERRALPDVPLPGARLQFTWTVVSMPR